MGADFEVRVNINKLMLTPSPGSSGAQFGRGGGGRGFGGGPHSGTPGAPVMEELVIRVPLPADVRNLSEVRPSKGDASYNPGEKVLEWHVPTKEISSGMSYFGLRCTVVGQIPETDGKDIDPTGFGFGTDYSYNEPYQGDTTGAKSKEGGSEGGDSEKDAKRIAQNKILMPTSASVSFAVKGWLPSGIKVESIAIDPRKSKGLGESVKPYKGVKYLTVSKGGVEIRC